MAPTIRTLRRSFLAATLALLPLAAAAQAGYPNKPIRVIVPFAAGSTTDIIARAISDKMSASLGQQLVVENNGAAPAAPSASSWWPAPRPTATPSWSTRRRTR